MIFRYRVHPSQGFDYVNPAATRITGYTPEEHYADPDLGLKLVHPEDRLLYGEMLRHGPTPARFRLRWLRKDGTTVWTEHHTTPVVGEGGVLVAIEGIAREIADPTGNGDAVRIVGGLRIDLLSNRVWVDGELVRLTPSEYRLLVLLSGRPNEVVSRREIVEHLWASAHVGSERTGEVHVSNLRRKIERDPRFPQRIVTARRLGYTLRPV